MEKQKKLNSNIYEGIFFMIIGISLIIYSLISYSNSFNKDWSQSPYAFPILVSIFICLLSISLLVQGFKTSKQTEINKKVSSTLKPNIKGVIVVISMSAIYYAALSLVSMPMFTLTIISLAISVSTFEVATILFLFALLFYLGVRNKLKLVLIPISTTIFLSIAFRTLLYVLLP